MIEPKQNIATIISLVGLLIGLLINAFNTIDFTGFDDLSIGFLKLMFLLAAFCLTISAFTGVAVYLESPPKGNPVKLFISSCMWLTMGIMCIFLVITEIILKSLILAILLCIVLLVAIIYENKENKIIQIAENFFRLMKIE